MTKKHENGVRKINVGVCNKCRSEWPNSLRLGSVADRLLGIRVRIPPEAWMFVFFSVVCCQVGVSALAWSLVQRSPTECDVSECDSLNLHNEETVSHQELSCHKKYLTTNAVIYERNWFSSSLRNKERKRKTRWQNLPENYLSVVATHLELLLYLL